MTEQSVKLVSITPNAEELMAYCARVSNPANQSSPQIDKLLGYCVLHGHWSVFEQANMVIEIQTTRAIAPQILRHRSFTFQEFSQRYAQAAMYIPFKARRQDHSNKQNSIDDFEGETQDWFFEAQRATWDEAFVRYTEAINRGIAKESARALLPLNTVTKLYMNGTVRNWIHYIQLRSKPDTQLEHREIAVACQRIFAQNLPNVSRSLGWNAEVGHVPA